MEEGEIKSNATALLDFFENFKPLLEYFQNNPIEVNESEAKRFPKYIKDSKLFEFQIQEPFFRKSILTQLKMVFLTSKQQMKSNSSKFGPFSESEKKRLKKYQDLINFLLKRYKVGNSRKSLSDAIKKSIKMEGHWMNWKNEGCKPYIMVMPEDDLKKFQRGQNLEDPDYAKIGKMSNQIKKWLKTNVDYTHLEALDKTNLMVFQNSFIVRNRLEISPQNPV